MTYENRVVCFIDILGFSSMVSKTLNSDDTYNDEQISHIYEALECIRDTLDIDEENQDTVVTQFSDSVVISFCSDEESQVFNTLLDIQHVLIRLIYRGILCRGGVAIGAVVHNDKYLFGPAMIDAYTLESKAANYPRVILSEEIIKLAGQSKSQAHTEEEEMQYVMSLLQKDSDGMYFIDYIGKSAQQELDEPALDYPIYLSEIANILATGINSKRPDIQVKYSWLKERYNEVLEPIRATLSGSEVSDYEQSFLDLPNY